MSTTREVTVWCDTEGCPSWTYGAGSNNTVKETRRGAKAQGWAFRGGKDICPRCLGDQCFRCDGRVSPDMNCVICGSDAHRGNASSGDAS